MPAWGQSRGNQLGYKIFIFILKTGGLTPAYLLLRFVTLYYFFFPGKAGKSLSYYFSKRLGYSNIKTTWSIYQNFNHLGRSLIDRVVAMSDMPSPFTMDYGEEQYLHDMVSASKGGLLISAHLGNWEVAGQLLNRIPTTIHIVMFEGEHEKIKNYMDRVAQKNFHVIVIKEDLSHIYEINEAFQKNEFVCIHADRFVEGNRTIKATLLERATELPLGPFILAITFKVPVMFVNCMKEGKKHFRFYGTFPKTYKEGKKDLPNIVQDYCACMEEMINKYPLQWHNYFPFWDEEKSL
jgi:predicted LPLAT superfamily acyltransferase